MHGRLVARAAEEERRREKKKRYAIEDFRYAMRKVDPPLSLEASYEEVRPPSSLCCQGNLVNDSARVSVFVCHQVEEQLRKIKEYSLVEDPEDRKGAWEKFVKRQKVRSSLQHFRFDLYLTFIAIPFRKSYGRRSERHLPAIMPDTRRTPTETESSQTVGVDSLTLINQTSRGRRTRRTKQT